MKHNPKLTVYIDSEETFSFESIATDQVELVDKLSESLRTGEKADDSTPFVSSGGGKKMGTAGNAGVSRF